MNSQKVPASGRISNLYTSSFKSSTEHYVCNVRLRRKSNKCCKCVIHEGCGIVKKGESLKVRPLWACEHDRV